MKRPANIERIKYLAYHHKKARVRKKNLKRLQKYGVRPMTAKDIVDALNKLGEAIANAIRSVAASLSTSLGRYPQDPRRIVDNVDRCISCGIIIPEGRQVCPSCEGSAKNNER